MTPLGLRLGKLLEAALLRMIPAGRRRRPVDSCMFLMIAPNSNRRLAATFDRAEEEIITDYG